MHYSINANDVFIGLGAGSVAERRAKIEQEESALLAERKLQLREQRSTMNSAHQRICLWEKLHRLHLPLTINHKLLEVIAKETELTLAAVQHEQARRSVKKPSNISG